MNLFKSIFQPKAKKETENQWDWDIEGSINSVAAKIGEPEFYYDAGYQDDDAKTSVAWRMTRRDANGKNVALVIYDWKHWNYRGKEINRNEVIRFHAVCDKPDLFPEFAFLKRANYLNQVKN